MFGIESWLKGMQVHVRFPLLGIRWRKNTNLVLVYFDNAKKAFLSQISLIDVNILYYTASEFWSGKCFVDFDRKSCNKLHHMTPDLTVQEI